MEHDEIEFLQEQIRIFQELHRGKRLHLSNNQRRRLAAKGKRLGRSVLGELITIVTPDTILRWHRELIARKYDGSDKRRPDRPRVYATWSRSMWSTTILNDRIKDWVIP